VPGLLSSSEGEELTYSQLLDRVRAGQVDEVQINTQSYTISGEVDGRSSAADGPAEIPEQDLAVLRENDVAIEYRTPQPNFLVSFLPFFLPVLLLIGFFVWMQRRAQGQMGSVMQIGRSKAKTYSSRSRARPSPTSPATRASSRRSPRSSTSSRTRPASPPSAPDPEGRAARRPARDRQDAHRPGRRRGGGVPFLSVTGSDFMEMFVGVGRQPGP
jgi:cell division protease FtsH